MLDNALILVKMSSASLREATKRRVRLLNVPSKAALVWIKSVRAGWFEGRQMRIQDNGVLSESKYIIIGQGCLHGRGTC